MKDVLRQQAGAGPRPGAPGERPMADPGLSHVAGPAGDRAGRVGCRALGGGAAGRLGRRRHKGRGAGRRSHAPRLRLTGHRQRHAEPGLRPRQPGQAQRGAGPAPARGPASIWRTCWRRRTSSSAIFGPTPSTGSAWSRRPRWPATPVSSTAASAGTACAATSGTARPMTSVRSGPGRDCRCRWPTTRATRSTPRGGIGDHITGLAALAGLLAAVLEQRATGQGRVVEVSLLRTGRLRARLGPRAADDARQGGPGRAEGPQPGAADEPVPRRRRAVVLLHRPRGGPPHRRRLPCPRPTRLLDDPRFADASRHPPPPDRGHRHVGRDRRPATSGRLGRAVRPRGRVVGAGADAGRGGRRPPAAGQRRVSSRSTAAAPGTGQRSMNGPVSFSDAPRAAGALGPGPRPAHRGGARASWPIGRRGARGS